MADQPEDWKSRPVGSGWKPLRFNPKNHGEAWPVSGRRWQVTVNAGSMPESLQEDVASEEPERWEHCGEWLTAMLPKQRWLASLEEGVQGNRHLQMIIVNDGMGAVRQQQIVEHLGHPHYEPMKKGIALNVSYVTKATSVEKGKHLAGPWKNGDWDQILEDNDPTEEVSPMEKLRRLVLDLGNTMVSRSMILHDSELGVVALNHPSAFNMLLEQRAADLQEQRQDQERQCLWLWGTTATGKSYDVRDLQKKGYIGSVYRTTSQKHPFDAYGSEYTIWLEEYRGGIDVEAMLSITDRWSSVVADARYFNHPLLHENVIVTSNVPPYDLYEHLDPATQDAWLRRWKVFEKKDRNHHPLHEFFNVPADEWPDHVDVEALNDPIPEDPEWLDEREREIEWALKHDDTDYL